MRRALVARAACALACAALLGASRAPARSATPAGAGASLDVLDFLELQIVYTTVLARYYVHVRPSTLVDGARVGIAADLIASGIRSGELPYTPPNERAGDGEDAIDAMVLRQLARYGERLNGHRLVQAAVAGELAQLHDPYSLLFRPAAYRRFNAFLGNGAFGGIGAVLSRDPGSGDATIERILAGSPAERAGLRRGDEIVSIDGHDVRSLANGAALVGALRGTIGTPVRIAYVRGDAPVPAIVTLVRAAVRDPEVTTSRFGDVGYVALSRFGDRSGDDLVAAVRALAADGVRGIVLDLRANGGGYGDQATAVASAFVRSGTIFTTRERGGATTVAPASGKPVWTGPLAVLVDGDTASAAEIVAGAIQDDGVGTIVGTRTFGKGVVQSIFPLPDGSAVKLTTARYATPKGRDIDRRGIEPDVVVAEPPGARVGDPAADPQLARALTLLGGAAHTGP